MDLYTYVVRYDSGFAPNPFHGFCTLATCKPPIRDKAQIGDWVVGCGSANKVVKQGGRLVYAMKVSEVLSFNDYFSDSRFQVKKPILNGSRKQARGDNIYFNQNGEWSQLSSFHSKPDGTPNSDHIDRDTKVDRVLVSDNFLYFGANGPLIPKELVSQGKPLCHAGIGRRKFKSSDLNDVKLMNAFEKWLESLDLKGFYSIPYDWHDSQ